MAASEQKLNKIFDQNVQITGNLTVDGDLVGFSGDNFYLDGITKSGNTLTFSVNGTTNQTYTFGSAAFANTTAFAAASHGHSANDLTSGTLQGSFGVTGNISGYWIYLDKASNNNGIHIYAGSGGKINWDARDFSINSDTGARIHKWNRNVADTVYLPYYENWYDGNSYHTIGVENNKLYFDGSELIHAGNKDSYTYPPATHNHDGTYVKEGGVSFNGEYPVVVRTSADVIYSDANIRFRGSDSRLTVDGSIETPRLKVTGSNNGNFGYASFSWSGSSGYPTLFSDHPDRWVMHVNPHIVWAQNGQRGFTGSTKGSMIRFEGNLGASTYWDAGVLTDISSGGDHWGIMREGTWAFYADPSANLHANSSMRAPIFYDSDDTNYYLNANSTSRINRIDYTRIQSPSSSNAARFENHSSWGTLHQTNSGYIQLGPANTGHAHIYTDRADFYFNRTLIVSGGSEVNSGDIRSAIFYDSDNTGYYFNGHQTTNLNSLTVNGTFTVVNGTINMNNNDGFIYDDGANVMKVKYDGTEYAIWTQANDGPGSGLDADLLDGNHGSYFDHRRYTDSNNYLGGYYVSGGTEKPNSSVFGPGKLKIAMLRGGSNNLGFGGTWNDVLWMSTYSGGDVKRSTALVSSKYDNTSLWIAKQSWDAADWGTGYLIWNSGNDGAGSGLDADTVDGLQASQFLRSDTSDTMSGNLTFSGNSRYIDLSGGTTSSQNSLIIGEQNTYGVRFRWDSGSALQFDGYWNSSTTGTENRDLGYIDVNNRIWYLNQRVQANESLRAPIFYDSDNTSYYLNAASTSRLNQVDANYLDLVASSAYAVRFWNGSHSYSIRMSDSISGTYGGRVSGETTSDYNMYFTMSGGTNRGFVFRNSNSASSCVAGIDGVGTIRTIGDVIAYASSDKRLKDNITPIDNPIDKVHKISGVTFDWNDKQDTYEHGKHDVGVIAQEIEEVLPEVVDTRENGYKAVKYEKIVPLLIEAIKEQQKQIDELKKLINP